MPLSLILFFSVVLALPGLSQADPLSNLRQSQNAELMDLQKTYHQLAQERVPRLANGRLDTTSAEYAKLLEEYGEVRRGVMAQYKELDAQGRGRELAQTLDEYRGRIANTGSKTGDPYGLPKNVQADIDLAAGDLDAAEDLTRRWVGKNQRKSIEIYTLDNPRQPTLVSPENLDQVEWKRVIKAVNPNTDTTLWTPQTEEIRRAKVADPDAWTSPGALKGTGNEAMPSDKRGFVLDNEGKLLHADRPMQPVAGGHDEDLKTFAKSLSKAGGATGRVSEKPELYKQAKTLQEYGDPYEAGIATLGEDAPAQAAQKVEQWKAQAREEVVEIKQISQKAGDRTDTYREELARQVRESADKQRAAGRANADQMEGTAQAIEDRRKLVADGNRDVAAENRRLQAEADEAYGQPRNAPHAEDSAASDLPDSLQKTQVRSADDVMDDVGGTRLRSPELDSSGRSAKPSWDTGPSEVAAIGPDAKVRPIDGRQPKAKANYLGGVGAGLEIGGQLLERSSRQMGQAVDENRDLNAGDAAEIAADMVPGVAGYKGSQQALLDRQVQRLKRQDRIGQLEAKANRSLEEEVELNRLQHAEAADPDTALGNAASMAREGVAGYFGEMEAQARQEGREKPEFLKDGLPMFGRMARDAVNAINPINQTGSPLVEGAAELSTLDERADWAGQKVEMTAYVNRKALWADKRTQEMVSELDRLLLKEDMGDPKNRKRAEVLLRAIEMNQQEIDKLTALADNQLGEVDPAELAALRGIARSQPSLDALRDYANQMQGDASPDGGGSTATLTDASGDAGWGEAKRGFAAVHGSESAWGEGGFEENTTAPDPRIGRIVELSERCAYQEAHGLATQVLKSDSENVWVKSNYPAIRDWAQREKTYNQAIAAALRAVQGGDLDGAVSSLKQAMENAASQCRQDQLVRRLLDQALGPADDGGRQAAIERAKQEGRSRSTYSSAPTPQRGQGQDNSALINSLTDMLTTINRGSSGSRTSSGSLTNPDDVYKNINTRRWDDAAKSYSRGNPAISVPEGYHPSPSPVAAPPLPSPTTVGGGRGEFPVDPDASRRPPSAPTARMIGPCVLGDTGGCLYEDGWHDKYGGVHATSEAMRRANGGT